MLATTVAALWDTWLSQVRTGQVDLIKWAEEMPIFEVYLVTCKLEHSGDFSRGCDNRKTDK